MSTVNGIGSSSLSSPSLDNARAEQSAELDASEWFSPALALGSHVISPISSFDGGASVDQLAQQVVSHICISTPQGS